MNDPKTFDDYLEEDEDMPEVSQASGKKRGPSNLGRKTNYIT
jgi:hypothetical protein